MGRKANQLTSNSNYQGSAQRSKAKENVRSVQTSERKMMSVCVTDAVANEQGGDLAALGEFSRSSIKRGSPTKLTSTT